jgi:uncharacterized Ntn-hydrolase superfamily protein
MNRRQGSLSINEETRSFILTFSVVARCERTGQIGVAATTALQAVGKLACHAMANVGAIASQALLNPYLAYDGLRLLEQGASAEEALERVLATDPAIQNRQVGVVDTQGRTAAWTGADTIQWSGHRAGHHFSAQGNRLASPQVLERVVQTMHETAHLDLAQRFVLALLAGEEVGGDTKGERSVNVLVFGEEEYPLCDIRIDDHDAPMQELRRLFQLYQEQILPNMMKLPRRADIPRPI